MDAASAESVWERAGPLETPELLEKVLSYVAPEDLKNARAVAKLWRDESLDNIRKSLVYVLYPTSVAERLLKLTLGIQQDQGGPLVGQHPTASPDTIYRLQDKPLKKFRLVGDQEFPPDMESFEGKRYFWEQCAPHVTYLHLKRRSNFLRKSFVDGFIWILKRCPNLEELTMSPMWAEGYHGGITGRDDEFIGIKKTGPFIINMNGFLHGPKSRISKKDLAKMRENPAPKVKSFSTELSDIYQALRRDPAYNHPAEVTRRIEYYFTTEHVNEWRYMLTLMPGLKNLSINTHFHYAMDALIEGSVTTGQLIQLESFTFVDPSPNPNSLYSSFDFPPLLEYIGKLKDVGGSLKNLCLKGIPFERFRNHPKSFRNIMFHTRKTIEKLELGIMDFGQHKFLVKFGLRFDLFSFNFPNLTELTLDFYFNGSAPGPDLVFFDFNLFRGTPNLNRFRMKCSIPDKICRKKLQTKDLEENGRGGKARWDDLFTAAPTYLEDPELIHGDGTETFDGENELVLEKMKEFYFTGRFTTEALLLLGKWMGNLKEFAAIFDEETLSIPFVVWPGTLRKLTVMEASFEEGISAKLISNLLEMYPEIEIVLEGDTDLILDGRGLITQDGDDGW